MSENIKVSPEMENWLKNVDELGWDRNELAEILKGNYVVVDEDGKEIAR